MSNPFNGCLVGLKITPGSLGDSRGKINSLYKESSQMIFPLKSNTACGWLLSFHGGSRRQKFKPLNARIRGSFISRGAKEPNIEHLSVLHGFFVLLYTESHGNMTAKPWPLQVLCSSVHSIHQRDSVSWGTNKVSKSTGCATGGRWGHISPNSENSSIQAQ